MGTSVARALLEEIRKEEGLRRELAEELVAGVLGHRKLRRIMLMSISREVAINEDLEKLREATKEDIEGLRREVKEDMERLREEVKDDVERLRKDLKSYVDARMNDLNAGMDDLYGVVKPPWSL